MIKNIIFDLGGVLINIDYNLTINSFKKLGYENFEEMYSQYKANLLFEKLETGHVEEETFYQSMMHGGAKELTKDHITSAWNAMLLDFRVESLEFLKALKPKYNLFLLSNTNIIHKRRFDTLLREQVGLNSIDSLLHKSYYSHLIGLRKPHREAFEFVLSDAGIEASKTLFIDDSYPNIEAAAHLGIRSELLKPGELVEVKYDYLISS